jgi:hypothetical protein
VDPDEREVEHGLGHEVAVADGVEAVVEHAGESEVGGVADGVDRQRRPGERAGAERRHVEAVDRGEEPVDVASECPPVRQQVMGEQDRLRPLEVGVPRQVRVAGTERAFEQHRLEIVDRPRATEQFALAPQTQVGGDLIVAATGRCAACRRPVRRAR